MSVLLLLQSQGEAPPPPPVVASAPLLRLAKLPRVFFSADGNSLELDDWSFSSTADLGYHQLRGTASTVRARKVAGAIDQGSVLRAFTEDGATVWEGTVPQPPKLTQDGRAFLAAQGFGYQAVKSGQRITPIVNSPGAWIPANSAPVNFPSTSSFVLTVVNSILARTVRPDFTSPGVLGSEWAIAFVARGMNLTRFSATLQGVSANGVWKVYSANLPDVEKTATLRYISSTTSDHSVDVKYAPPPLPFRSVSFPPSDVVILQYASAIGGGAAVKTITNPVVWGDYDFDAVYSDLGARIVARQLGWDDTGVTGRGAAPHTTLDHVGDGASFLSKIAGMEDFCWGAWQDTGMNFPAISPLLTFGPYGRRTWEVSASTGATWDLTPLERIRRATVQFLNVDNTLNEVTLEAPNWVGLPDSVDTEIKGSLPDAQDDFALPASVTWNTLRRMLEQRFRGNVSFAHAFDADSREDNVYQVRAGDLLRITDFTMDGSVTLRIQDVECSAAGVSVGIEASAVPLGGTITGKAGPGAAAPLPLAATTGGVAVYAPPGGPGSGGGWQPPGHGPGGGGPRFPGYPRF